MRYVLWVLLILILFLLFCPIKIKFYAENGKMSAVLSLYFYKMNLLAPKKKKQDSKSDAAGGERASSGKKKESKEKEKPTLDFIMGLMQSLFHGIGFISRRLHFDNVDIALTVGKDEPDETAVFFGQVNGALYAFLGLAASIFKVSYKRVSVTPDFENRIFLYRAGFSFWALPVTILVTAIIVAVRFFQLQPAEKNIKDRRKDL